MEVVQVQHARLAVQTVVEGVAVVVEVVINLVLRIVDHVALHLVILIVVLHVLVGVMVMDALKAVVDVGLDVVILALVVDVPVFYFMQFWCLYYFYEYKCSSDGRALEFMPERASRCRRFDSDYLYFRCFGRTTMNTINQLMIDSTQIKK